MNDTSLLDPVRILRGPGLPVQLGAVLIEEGVLIGFDDDARQQALLLGIQATPAPNQLVAPCLVDPHSILETPFSGDQETAVSLRHCAAAAGYGQIALLPRSSSWRDRPERLQGFNADQDPTATVRLHLWGSFSRSGKAGELAPHGDLLEHGAIGLADDNAMVPAALLQQGLLLGEMGGCPVLVAPRDPALQGEGLVREGVETLRAGWPADPITSETVPLSQLLLLHQCHPDRQLRLMNLSTAAAVDQLSGCEPPPLSSVSWWHLLTDRSMLTGSDHGWRVCPSLGGPKDRDRLIQAVQERTVTAVAVHAVPLDAEDMLLPGDQRPAGLSGHHLVLPALWNALVRPGRWTVEDLWQALSFGPSALIDQPPEQLKRGSRRWLLFDPDQCWTIRHNTSGAPRSANVPWLGRELKGRVTACGLSC
ncbi:dihydroorotase [Synechococcus sp. KORDI-52]|uniref:dihydroorotase n=1 Tax=Synechococcus sp. KORDI-52 TaxID=585425 RepID=UPI000571F683|nr:dihydroorotase [Synechococcus sp. KORDI-52]